MLSCLMYFYTQCPLKIVDFGKNTEETRDEERDATDMYLSKGKSYQLLTLISFSPT